eukprot:IDg12266t1
MLVLISIHSKERSPCSVEPTSVGEIIATPSGKHASQLIFFWRASRIQKPIQQKAYWYNSESLELLLQFLTS